MVHARQMETQPDGHMGIFSRGGSRNFGDKKGGWGLGFGGCYCKSFGRTLQPQEFFLFKNLNRNKGVGVGLSPMRPVIPRMLSNEKESG